MPRSIQEILDHADDLARRFEEYEPYPDDEVDVAEHLLRRAALARARTEHQIAEAVVAARAAGLSWKRIGEQLGTSAQAAQQRYGSFVETP
jgi:cation transport ATPase